MKNKKEDMFDNLSFTDGKEKIQKDDILAKTPTKKKSKKVVIDKNRYSLDDLKNKSSDALTKICLELKIPVVRRKTQMIENILNNK